MEMKRNTHIQVLVFLSVFFSMLLNAMPVRAQFLTPGFMKQYALRNKQRAEREVLSLSREMRRLKREYKLNPSASIQSQIDSLEAKRKEAKKDLAYWNDVCISYSPYEITTDTIFNDGLLCLRTDVVIPLKEGGYMTLGMTYDTILGEVLGKYPYTAICFSILFKNSNSAINLWIDKQLESGSSPKDGFSIKNIEGQTIKLTIGGNEVLTNSDAYISLAKYFDDKRSFVVIKCRLEYFRSNKTNENSFAYLRQLFETRNITKIEFCGFEFNIDSGRIAYTLKEMFERIYGKSAEE